MNLRTPPLLRKFGPLAAVATCVAVSVLGVTGGCTASARDEYNYVRDLRVAPSTPGEISLVDDRMPTVAQSDFRPRRWAEATRPGAISDADIEPR